LFSLVSFVLAGVLTSEIALRSVRRPVQTAKDRRKQPRIGANYETTANRSDWRKQNESLVPAGVLTSEIALH
jgi:hypothetical protein